MAGVSHYVMNKLTHGNNVTTAVLGRICIALGCSPEDIMEFIIDQIGLDFTWYYIRDIDFNEGKDVIYE